MALLNSDIKGNRVTINKTLRSHKIGVLPTKTIASIREILIDDKTLQLLNEFRYGDYVFGGAYPLSSSSIQRIFDKAISESGVKRIRLHDLRHSHATILINSGANIVAVSKRLGHSSINMTLQVYTHLLDETEAELLKYL